MSCLNHQARVRELWIMIHHHHIPFSGSTTLTLWFTGLLACHSQSVPRPHTPSRARRRTRRQSAPRPLSKHPSHVWGKGNMKYIRAWASLVFFNQSPWAKRGSRPPVLPVRAMGPRLPIHTTMAQPLAFLILDGIGWELRVYPSPGGPPRYERSPPKPIQSPTLYTNATTHAPTE